MDKPDFTNVKKVTAFLNPKSKIFNKGLRSEILINNIVIFECLSKMKKKKKTFGVDFVTDEHNETNTRVSY